MKKLEKLITKKVASAETIKGGRYMQMEEFLEDDQTRTTENKPTWNGQHWVTDVHGDPK